MENLQIIVSSYFAYFGAEVAQMLEAFSETDQRRITQMFMNIIEGDHFKTDDDGNTELTIPVAKDIEKVVEVFVKFYCMDKEAGETLERAKRWTLSVNKR